MNEVRYDSRNCLGITNQFGGRKAQKQSRRVKTTIKSGKVVSFANGRSVVFSK